jgi:hypothetical protein
VDEALTTDLGVEQIVGFQGGPPPLEYLDGEIADDLLTECLPSGLDVGAAVPLRARLTPSAGPVAVESALTVPPTRLVFGERGVFAFAFARDVETVVAEESVGECLEAAFGGARTRLRHETEGCRKRPNIRRSRCRNGNDGRGRESIDIYSRSDTTTPSRSQTEGEASKERRSEQWSGCIKAHGDAYRKQQEHETVEAERLQGSTPNQGWIPTVR